MGDNRFVDDAGNTRLRDVDFVFPVCLGTVAFYLGKKASEYNSHRWTVYVRGPNNDDITHVVQKVTFQLHSSFKDNVRTVETAPFELTETGWGEFEIGITITMVPEACVAPVELFHRLKLYSEEEGAAQSTKKPVVMEQLEELVFSEPVEAFYQRVSTFTPGPAPESPHKQYFPKHDERAELEKIRECRAKITQAVEAVKRQFDGA